MRARQLSVLADPVLNATVDHIIGGGRTQLSVRVLGEVLAQLRKDIDDLSSRPRGSRPRGRHAKDGPADDR